jgi:hypothetical protein
MFDPNNEKCKCCEIAIAFLMKFRIGEEEQKRLCKTICGRKKKEDNQPDLFDLDNQES